MGKKRVQKMFSVHLVQPVFDVPNGYPALTSQSVKLWPKPSLWDMS